MLVACPLVGRRLMWYSRLALKPDGESLVLQPSALPSSP
jgi:hypothetical protein